MMNKKLNILVVDDDKLIRTLLVECLFRCEKFNEVHFAEEGNAALSIMENSNIDILLTDINMPNGMDGFKLIEEAVNKGITKNIFVFSGNSYNKDLIEMEERVKKFYSKPILNINRFIDEIISLSENT